MGEREEMAGHEAAFISWLRRQGDVSATSVVILARRAFFDGAQYGLEKAKQINAQVDADFCHE